MLLSGRPCIAFIPDTPGNMLWAILIGVSYVPDFLDLLSPLLLYLLVADVHLKFWYCQL